MRDISSTIVALENRRCAALLENNLDELGLLLSQRLTFGHANAAWDDRETLLTKLKGGAVRYLSMEVVKPKVIDLGNVALLTSHLKAHVLVNGAERKLHNSTLSVWAHEDGVWRLLAYQPTPMPSAS